MHTESCAKIFVETGFRSVKRTHKIVRYVQDCVGNDGRLAAIGEVC